MSCLMVKLTANSWCFGKWSKKCYLSGKVNFVQVQYTCIYGAFVWLVACENIMLSKILLPIVWLWYRRGHF